MWSNQCLDELKKHCNAIVVADNVVENDCTAMVPFNKWNIDPEASFFSFCSNETVNGWEWDFDYFPWHLIPKDCPVCIDMSSNIGTNNIPWDKVGVIYAGAQKNLGTAGCTVIIVRQDLMHHAVKDTPIMNDWKTFELSPDRTYNTPGIYSIYITGLNVSYMNQMGGLDYYITLCRQRSMILWDFIDRSGGYYRSKITDKKFRSNVNVVFRIQDANEGLESSFIEEAKAAGIVNIKAHYFCPGIRISMYNSMPIEGVSYLINFMRCFMQRYPNTKYVNSKM